ncbi:hypothetical protein [Infirmifilum sp.]|uniref:hypothetical protein n=1 Tax=Infirmifilum sp. TaxID=2856575 RepID=UPI003D0ED9B2
MNARTRLSTAVLLILLVLLSAFSLTNTVTKPLTPPPTVTITTTVTTFPYVVLTVPSTPEANDVITVHLYDFYFDGVSAYTAIPITVYGWSEITIVEWFYLFRPKNNTYWSKTGMIGDQWTDYPSTGVGTGNGTYYTYWVVGWNTRKPDGTQGSYFYSLNTYMNTWINLVRRFTSAREISYWINGSRVYRNTVSSTEKTVLEWNPSTATYPDLYKRYVLGANLRLAEYMTMYQSMLLIYSRALSDDEIRQFYSSGVVNTTGLMVFLDPTFFNGTSYVDILGKGNTFIAYNTQRIPSSTANIRLYLIKNLTQDGLVHLRFFPSGTKIVLNGGQTITIDVLALAMGIRLNGAGLYEDIPISPAFASSIVAFYVPKP